MLAGEDRSLFSQQPHSVWEKLDLSEGVRERGFAFLIGERWCVVDEISVATIALL